MQRLPSTPLGTGSFDAAYDRLATRRLVKPKRNLVECCRLVRHLRASHLVGTVLLEAGRADGSSAEIQNEPGDFRIAYLAIVYHRMGRKSESDAALAEYTEAHSDDDAYDIADCARVPQRD